MQAHKHTHRALFAYVTDILMDNNETHTLMSRYTHTHIQMYIWQKMYPKRPGCTAGHMLTNKLTCTSVTVWLLSIDSNMCLWLHAHIHDLWHGDIVHLPRSAAGAPPLTDVSQLTAHTYTRWLAEYPLMTVFLALSCFVIVTQGKEND